jgi:pyruvate dehydrogenase E2 component (dihydrolipoamide acetyltransferase)
MADVIRMPRLSDTMEEGNIIAWLKKVGDKVSPGDVLAEVETDKATMDLESFQEGTLLYIGVAEGLVPVDGILAIIGEEGEDYEALLDDVMNSSNGENPSAEAEETSDSSIKEENTQAIQVVSMPEPSIEKARVKASPLAKKIAKEAGIDITSLSGTGEAGRIIKRDIETLVASNLESAKIEIKPDIHTPEVAYGDHPLSQMRKTIARRLGESKFSAPHFYLTIEINMGNAVKARKQINEVSASRISFNDIILKACALSLRRHPWVNASWMGDKITVNKDINIGVAVAVDEGLLVPVVPNTDLKSLSMINQEVRSLAKKAKSKKLQLPEMQGNTFTVSNLGMFDIDEFTAIINPPDSCILAVGSIVQKPIVKNGEITVGDLMKVTLSCDHRVVDGAKGAAFLQSVKEYLENPVMMLV